MKQSSTRHLSQNAAIVGLLVSYTLMCIICYSLALYNKKISLKKGDLAFSLSFAHKPQSMFGAVFLPMAGFFLFNIIQFRLNFLDHFLPQYGWWNYLQYLVGCFGCFGILNVAAAPVSIDPADGHKLYEYGWHMFGAFSAFWSFCFYIGYDSFIIEPQIPTSSPLRRNYKSVCAFCAMAFFFTFLYI